MNKARFILTALVLLAGIGGALAFKASRFSTNPVQVTTDFTTIKVLGLTYTAYAGLNGAPVTLCQPDFIAFWSFVGVRLNEFSTLPLTTTIPFTATTTTAVGGPTVTVTVTRTVHTCTSTVGFATFEI